MDDSFMHALLETVATDPTEEIVIRWKRLISTRRPKRRGGWQKLVPRSDRASTGLTYFERFRLGWESSEIAKDLEKDNYDDKSHDGLDFRRTYGVPRRLFDTLVSEAAALPAISVKAAGDGTRRGGPTTVPVSIKLAATLLRCKSALPWRLAARKLGKISERTAGRFSEALFRGMVEHHYDTHVHPPRTPHEIQKVLDRHDRMGFPGCISMWDGVPVAWDACPSAEMWLNKGKEGYPTRKYLVAGEGTGIIHEVTGSFIGTANDLTMSMHSSFYRDLRFGDSWDEVTYELYTDPVTKARDTFKRPWCITDNGLHKWSINMMPERTASEIWLRRWSKRLESARKPGSECIFGRWKKVWRIMDRGLDDSNVSYIDDMARFTVMLHNRCLRYDNLHTIGDFEDDWINLARMAIDDSRIWVQEPLHADYNIDPAAAAMNAELQVELGWLSWRTKLVTHYRTCWTAQEVQWPKTATKARGLRQDLRPKLCAKGHGLRIRQEWEANLA